jgi:HD-GYP domain-containing protein (c-di-GMP phosphodiesterase class II)
MDKAQVKEQNAALMVMESIYARNPQSPAARDKPPSLQYTELAGMLRDVLQNRFAGAPPEDVRRLPFTTLFSMAEMIVLLLARQPRIMLEVARPRYGGEPLVCHSLNVAFLSCRVAMQMGMAVKDLTEISVAALLHDIGMTKIDAAHFSHDRGLSAGDQEKIEQHPEIGYRFLEKLSSDFPWLLKVILEEHKRENDRGYPAAAGGEQHTFSKIVGLCDSFEALAHERPFRKPFHPADAMKAIIADKELLYDKAILRAVIESIGMYPVGSLLKLNNNKIAQVVQTVPGSPLRPMVDAYEENFSDSAPVSLDLSKDNNLYVLSLVYTEEYAQPVKK